MDTWWYTVKSKILQNMQYNESMQQSMKILEIAYVLPYFSVISVTFSLIVNTVSLYSVALLLKLIIQGNLMRQITLAIIIMALMNL